VAASATAALSSSVLRVAAEKARLVLGQCLQRVEVVALDQSMQSRVARLVRGVDVAAVGDQQLQHVGRRAAAAPVQKRSAAVRTARVQQAASRGHGAQLRHHEPDGDGEAKEGKSWTGNH